MIKKIKKTNPSNTPVGTQVGAPTSHEATHASTLSNKRHKNMLAFTYSLVVLIVLLTITKISLLGWQVESSVDTNTYQAVALDNGQTFFGRLSRLSGSLYVLGDVYYLQRTADTTTAADGTSDTTAATDTTADSTVNDSGLQLIPLVDDIQQPQNHLVIQASHIVFWQNLQTDSPILDTIAQYHKQAE